MWGTNFSVLKVSLADVPPMFFASSRFVIALAVMAPLSLLTGDPLRVGRRDVLPILGVGLLGNGLYMALFVYGAARTSADNAALILATVPVWVALFAGLSGVERVARWGWAGVFLSLAGIACIVAGSSGGHGLEFGGASLAGDVLVLLSTMAWAGYSVLVKPLVRRCSPMSVTMLSAVAGAVPLLLLTLLVVPPGDLGRISTRGWITLVVSAVIGIALPYIIWNYGIRQLGSARTALYSYLVPFIALIVAWIWLGETLTPVQVAGGACVLAGVVLARRFVDAPVAERA
jgi:drug/metabolite transporter (DMT)-like permease